MLNAKADGSHWETGKAAFILRPASQETCQSQGNSAQNRGGFSLLALHGGCYGYCSYF